MKIVVIGGTGLIGSKVVAHLRQAGHEVIAASPGTGVNSITGEGGCDGRLIAAPCARPFFLDVRVPGSGSSSQSARGRCTMGLREGGTSQGGRRTPLRPAVHTIKRDDPAHVPAGTSGQPSQANAIARCGLSGHAGGPVKELAGPQHCVHHDRELSGDCEPRHA